MAGPGHANVVASSAIHWPTAVSSLKFPAGFCPITPHTTPDAPSGKQLDVGFFTTLTRCKPCPSPPTAAGAVPIPASKAGLTQMTCPGSHQLLSSLNNNCIPKFSELMLDRPERQPARDLRASCSILKCGSLADRSTCYTLNQRCPACVAEEHRRGRKKTMTSREPELLNEKQDTSCLNPKSSAGYRAAR